MAIISEKPHIHALTGLRYFAAMCVVLAHVSGNLEPGSIRTFGGELSGLGMPLFFVLSGFLMSYNYSKKFQQNFGRTLWSFYVARFARIYPIYIITLLLYFSFVGNFFHDLRDHSDDAEKSLAFVVTMTQSWFHSTVFEGTDQARTICLSYLGIGWSVSVEAFFYLAFPLFVLPIASSITSLRRTIIVAGVIFGIYLVADLLVVKQIPEQDRIGEYVTAYSYSRWLTYLSPYARLGEFLIGAIAGQYYLRIADRPEPSGMSWFAGALALATTAVALLILVHLAFQPHKSIHRGDGSLWFKIAATNVLLAPLCAVLMLLLARVPTAAQRFLGSGPLVLLGEASYCMYLMHPLMQSFYAPRANAEGPLKAWYVVAYNHLAMFVCLHFFCLGFYRYAETPLRTFIRRALDFKQTPKIIALTPIASEPAQKQAA